ncbi:hypothetical protein CR203_05055 [Salipaludibacillus neizhouensis]|uniref:Uncharacterized protein n=1 Tax=Salipaludibacillus neizhouensis TaxID=885475 RepID=A0A3A9KTC5_9BACI|nr:hypothetical protein [Salipaludibacillus neizhouensis]RKL67876.1 hypothetical protein CR203_05055 [Salipaludibacillus neizhouensis]
MEKKQEHSLEVAEKAKLETSVGESKGHLKQENLTFSVPKSMAEDPAGTSITSRVIFELARLMLTAGNNSRERIRIPLTQIKKPSLKNSLIQFL